ncbi:hypothetical protein JB92DRAFT_2796802 [Gautieria morchelliformis]|nr:hypothetical protein JB92DRAFT_2796802 [Gautieria morchelliformis]
MMGIALGGIGVISLRVPFTVSHSLWRLLDLPSILLAAFILAVFALIAYFTNPTEASFRAFLTELAFRQHLSRLSEAQDVDPDDYDDDRRPHNGSRLLDQKSTRKHGTPHGYGFSHGNTSASTTETPIVFHFANKASVSLRTPGYQFRSFAVLTFAIASPVEMAIAPVPVPNPAHVHAQPPKPISWSNPSTRGAWFVGAFGKWWLGLEMNMQPRQVRLTAQDDAALRERELARSRGDDVESGSGSRQTEESFSSHKASKSNTSRRTSSAAPPRTKAALRERLSLQTGSSHRRDAHAHTHTPSRSTTPPPLPKSASLPLHAKRVSPSSPDTRRSNSVHHSPPFLPTTIPDISASARTHASSTHDQSPIIADILRQLDAACSATSDLHAQLAEFQDASDRAHASLQTEVDAARVMKRREDAGRAEVKARTKVLDDARRQADGSKREAEKKLKAATAARDGASGRIERLGREVEELQRQMADGSVRAVESRIQADAARGEISETLAAKREEIKVAEDVVSALTSRARDLEDKIAEETARLQKLKADAEARRQRHAAVSQTDMSSWPPPLLPSAPSSPHPQFASHQVAPTLGTDTARPSAPADLRRSWSPRPNPLILGGISNLAPSAHANGNSSDATTLDGQYTASTQFRSFADSPVPLPSAPTYHRPPSSVGSSLIPSSLIQPLENPRSTLPSSDHFYGRVPAIRPPPSDEHHSPIDEPRLPYHIHPFDSQRAVLPPRSRSLEDEPAPSKPRRWLSATAKEKGLNPDAKEFTLPGRPPSLSAHSGGSTPATFASDVFPAPSPAVESSPPPPPRVGMAGSFFSSLHNPFAPSPAEREALQRALGSGSGNTSLERVSSHGSGSGSGSAGGSHTSSPRWAGEPRRDPPVESVRRSFFNPWAGTDGSK